MGVEWSPKSGSCAWSAAPDGDAPWQRCDRYQRERYRAGVARGDARSGFGERGASLPRPARGDVHQWLADCGVGTSWGGRVCSSWGHGVAWGYCTRPTRVVRSRGRQLLVTGGPSRELRPVLKSATRSVAVCVSVRGGSGWGNVGALCVDLSVRLLAWCRVLCVLFILNLVNRAKPKVWSRENLSQARPRPREIIKERYTNFCLLQNSHRGIQTMITPSRGYQRRAERARTKRFFAVRRAETRRRDLIHMI